MLRGKDDMYKRAVMDGVHRALVDAFRIPDGDRMQMLFELDSSHFDISANKTEDCVVIELTVFKGRSYDAKKKLYSSITANLFESPGIQPDDVIIVVHEPSLENWGVRGIPASEAELGFDINV
jgi:phenylpyruvate tautomerase PptA (4-oxalocrotonate tautomerase family)